MKAGLFILMGYLSGSILYARVFAAIFGKKGIIENSKDKNPGTANAFMYGGFACGSNERLYQKLCAQKTKGTTVIKYTNDMAAYMRACHLLITKPGGLSSTEAAVCHVPLLHTATIPGCESYNARYFKEHEMSVSCELPDELPGIVKKLLENQDMREQIVACQKTGVNPDAAADICTLAEQIVAM